jgi:hypothetical protein
LKPLGQIGRERIVTGPSPPPLAGEERERAVAGTSPATTLRWIHAEHVNLAA